MTTPLAERLAARTLELVDIASVSGEEEQLGRHVARVLAGGGVALREAGDGCLLAGAAARGERPFLLLAGHFDTVPAQDNLPGRIEDGSVHGLGACDMKGALAVMIELALDRAAGPGGELGLGGAPGGELDLGAVVFPREELPFRDSALGPLLTREPGLLDADLAVVMEPTAGVVQAGCLGNVNATWTFQGRGGHSARPWLADNAVHRAARGIAALADVEPVSHESAGLVYREVVSVTQVQGGIARNVIPGEATAHVNYRYPPGIDAASAEARLHELCDPFGDLVIDGNAPSGSVPQGNALADRLVALAEAPVEAKQAWTPVAEFALAGVDAVNFGPGDPAHAHTRAEHVRVDALVHAYEVLRRLLSEPAT